MAMPRREFLWRTGRAGAGLAVLDRAGRLLGRESWSGPVARAAGASHPPVTLRFRQVHLDFHTSADVPDVAAQFDPDEFADTLKRAHVSSVTCFARCHHGYIYYDTRKNPERKHPHLARPRLLEEQIEACHKRDIRVPIYTTIQWDAFSADAHPEWRQVTETGALQGTPPYEPGFYRFLCLNPGSPYLEFLRGHLDDVFACVPVDGLFLDITHARECSCPLCRRDMLAKGLDPAKAVDRQAFGRETLARFVADTTAHIRAKSKDCTIFYNGGHVNPDVRPNLDGYSHLELESLPSGGWGYLHFPMTMRYARNLGVDCLGMTGKFHTSWGDFQSYKNEAALQFEVFDMLSLGAKCSIGDQLPPQGRLDPATYALIGSVYGEVEKKEPWCRDARALSDIAVLSPEEFQVGRQNPSALGLVRILQEGQHQFDIVDSTSDLGSYRLVILPDFIPLSPALAAKVDAYIAKGGAVLATYKSGLNEAGDAFATSVLGVRYKGDAPFSPDFLVPRGTLAAGLPGAEYVVYKKGLEVEPLPGSEVLVADQRALLQPDLGALLLAPPHAVVREARLPRRGEERPRHLLHAPLVCAVPAERAALVQAIGVERDGAASRRPPRADVSALGRPRQRDGAAEGTPLRGPSPLLRARTARPRLRRGRGRGPAPGGEGFVARGPPRAARGDRARRCAARLHGEGGPHRVHRAPPRRTPDDRGYLGLRAMFLEPWREDLRLAGLGLLRARAFTAAAVLTLAIGMAASTTVFALIEGVLLRPLPVPEQERLLVAWKALPTTGAPHWPFRAPEVAVLRDESRVLETVAGVSYYDPSPFAVVENGVASSITGAAVTGGFFRVLGAAPLLGRALRDADDAAGAENVLVITHALWQRRYGGSPDVLGRRLLVSERPFVIVGVMPPYVECPHGIEAWMTLAASASTVANPAFREGVLRDVDIMARLRPGATLAQAREELLRILSRLETDTPQDAVRDWTPVVRSYEDLVVGDTRPALLVLFGAVGLVLLIACANVASLLLVRGEARRPELAVRAVLGAGPGRLARQLIVESLLLALAAGVVGLTVARWSLRALLALVPEGLPRVDSVRIDAGVVLFTVAVAFLTAALAGLAPALSVARADLVAHLRGGGRGAAGGVSRPGRRALVVAQVALAVTVVAAAGLLTRSLIALQSAEMGLAADQLAFVRLAVPQAKYADAARHQQLMEEVVARLQATAGIAKVTPVHTPPFAGTGGWDAPHFTAEGQSADRAASNPSLNLESIHRGYFEALGVTLVRGRGFAETDRQGAPEVAVVSEDLAAYTWPGQDPIGKRIKLGRLDSAEAWRTVVGVAGPTRYRDLATPRATVYLPAAQFIDTAEMLILRTTSPLSLVARLTRERVSAIDPDVQVTSVAPFQDLLQGPLARPRFNTFLIGIFGVAAFLLAAVGLYAVMAASVRQRSPEMGVRIALGATASDVRVLVLGEGLRLAGLGAALGLTGALALTRLLRGLLYGVHPLDPLSMLAAALLLVGVSALASSLPARRATRVDPISLLRAE